jgi:hypothetical protein
MTRLPFFLYHLSKPIINGGDPIIKTTSDNFANLSLPEKEEKSGSDFFRDKEFTVEETKGCRWDHKKTKDQRDHKISTQSVFQGGINHCLVV